MAEADESPPPTVFDSLHCLRVAVCPQPHRPSSPGAVCYLPFDSCFQPYPATLFPVGSAAFYTLTFGDFCSSMSTGSFKATYQRARAHAALCNEEEARRDFDLVGKLDPKFKPFIRQELKKLGESMRVAHARQKKTYWDTTQEKWGAGGSEVKGAERKKERSEREREAVETTCDSEAAEKSECKMDEKRETEQEKEAEKIESEMEKMSESEQEKEEEKIESDADQKEEKSQSQMDKTRESEQEKEAEKGESEADKKAGKSESEMDERTGRSETTEE